MKILVTGAGGFLGGRVIERLLVHGYTDIRCLVRSRASLPKVKAICERYPKAVVEYRIGNLRSRADATDTARDVDIVFHLAAAMKGGAADMFADSVVASRNLLEALTDRKPLRIVLVSSFGVYGVASMPRGAKLDEAAPLEPHPERRDVYSHTKLRQEQLFWEYQQKLGFELVVLRPGVIYGPGGGHFSGRVGLNLFGVFLNLGGSNRLPLSYVDNCAEAVVHLGTHDATAGKVYNVHDDDLPTCSQYLRAYKRNVQKLRSVRIPYFLLMFLSGLLERYHRHSKGQLPAIFTKYKVASLWGGNRFDNRRLQKTGWKQIVSTQEGMERTFDYFRHG